MIRKQPVKSRNVCKVTFELPADVEAEAVHLHADVNDWQPIAFDRLKNGKWKLVQELEPGSSVQFRYRLIRGEGEQYVNDPEADAIVRNDWGSENAVIHC